MARTGQRARKGGVAKCPTGIRGLDQITFGGLPRNRPTLICGGLDLAPRQDNSGSGK